MKKEYSPSRLLSYVVASDNGLAPNVTGGVCTLAVCKPVVRAVSRIGEDWILGLSTSAHGAKRLIYAMQVDEKIPYADYYNDPRFACKKPDRDAHGDNFFVEKRGQLHVAFKNAAHAEKPEKIDRDLRAPFAVAGNRFWYFGGNAPNVPAEFHETKIVLPDSSRRGHRVVSDPETVKQFQNWLEQWPCGTHGRPRDLRPL